MSDIFYKLGAAKAAQDLGGFLSSGVDNPTTAPPAGHYTKTAITRMVEKLAEPKGKKVKPGSRKGGRSEPAARAPAGKGTRFKAMVRKLKKKKGVKDPGALAAAIGRSKFGKGKMQRMAKTGAPSPVSYGDPEAAAFMNAPPGQGEAAARKFVHSRVGWGPKTEAGKDRLAGSLLMGNKPMSQQPPKTSGPPTVKGPAPLGPSPAVKGPAPLGPSPAASRPPGQR